MLGANTIDKAADSSDSDRRANRLCSFSTKCCCVVGLRRLSTAIGGEVYCGREQRFKRIEQVAAARRWSVLLPQSALRYTRQLWAMFQRAETMMYSLTPFLPDRHLISRSSDACCVS